MVDLVACTEGGYACGLVASMYRRDFGVLVLSVFALWWSLQHEGAYEYRKAFYFNLPKQDELSEYHKLPSPVVVRHCDGPNLRMSFENML